MHQHIRLKRVPLGSVNCADEWVEGACMRRTRQSNDGQEERHGHSHICAGYNARSVYVFMTAVMHVKESSA